MAYIRPNRESDVVRFGFIVSKAVGTAVRRNLVRRRLKAAAYETLPVLTAAAQDGAGLDIVIRALPASAQAGWTSLLEEVSRATDRFLSRRSSPQRATSHRVPNEGNVRP